MPDAIGTTAVTSMPQWDPLKDDGLGLLIAVVCFIIALGYTAIVTTQTPSAGKCQRLLGVKNSIPILDGNDLYYDQKKWPQYEPRFNLRLSCLYGPVIHVKTEPKNPLAQLFQWVSVLFHPAWHPSRATILVNSLADEDGTLKRLLNSCASRATSIAAGKHLSRGGRIVLQPYGPAWARHRKAFASLLTKEKIKTQWAKAIDFEAMVLVDRISKVVHPADSSQTRVVDEISRFTASSVLQITYARRAATPEDALLKDLEVVSRNIGNAFTVGKYWVDEFPILDVFPALISPWKRKLNTDHSFESDLFSRLLQSVEERMAHRAEVIPAGDIMVPVDKCGAAQLLRNREICHVDREYIAAGLFEAGTETTAMSVPFLILSGHDGCLLARIARGGSRARA